MTDITAAALLGLSLGNVWICALVVFALQTSDRSACGGYLVGRFAGILGFTLFFWLIGGLWQPPHGLINIISALVMLLFVAYFYFRYCRGWIPFWVKKKVVVAADNQADHANCDHDCNTCPVHQSEEWRDACSSCADEKACSAEDIQVEALTRTARIKWNREVTEEKISGFMGGFALGGLRGGAMCGRMVILLPLVMTGTLAHATLVGSTFAMTSTIYPVIGMALGSLILKVLPHRQKIFNISALLLLGIAGFYLVKGIAALV